MDNPVSFELEMRGVEWSRLVGFFREELGGTELGGTEHGGTEHGGGATAGRGSQLRRFEGVGWRAELEVLAERRLGSLTLPVYRVLVEAWSADLAELRRRLWMRFISAGA